jgi:hypothetical protein
MKEKDEKEVRLVFLEDLEELLILGGRARAGWRSQRSVEGIKEPDV